MSKNRPPATFHVVLVSNVGHRQLALSETLENEVRTGLGQFVQRFGRDFNRYVEAIDGSDDANVRLTHYEFHYEIGKKNGVPHVDGVVSVDRAARLRLSPLRDLAAECLAGLSRGRPNLYVGYVPDLRAWTLRYSRKDMVLKKPVLEVADEEPAQ